MRMLQCLFSVIALSGCSANPDFAGLRDLSGDDFARYLPFCDPSITALAAPCVVDIGPPEVSTALCFDKKSLPGTPAVIPQCFACAAPGAPNLSDCYIDGAMAQLCVTTCSKCGWDPSVGPVIAACHVERDGGI